MLWPSGCHTQHSPGSQGHDVIDQPRKAIKLGRDAVVFWRMDSMPAPAVNWGAFPGRTARASRLRCALLVLLTCLHISVVRGADPQPYRVELTPTGIAELDSTLKATSQLEALRTAVPASPFGLLARARGDLERLKTAVESFGYYQS